MKITIDTKEDSHEEIQKAIRLLSALIVDKEIISNQVDIFGDSSDSSGSSGSSSGVFDKKKKDDDVDIGIPELEEYR